MLKQTPQLLKGFRDYLPVMQRYRQEVLRTISETFESFGFSPMDTPVLEYYDLLGGKYGDEGEQLMYKFEDRGGRMVAMRYDLTVPLARFVAENQSQIAMPFKRYQIGLVWRADKPQKGRYREFMQCDVDVLGTNSIYADIDCVVALDAAYKNLGLKNVVLKFNNRQLVDQALSQLKIFGEKKTTFMRTMDKVDKLDEGKVKELLEEARFASGILEDYSQAMDEMSKDDYYVQQMQKLLRKAGVEKAQFDKFLVRGIDYYTGGVYEFALPNKSEFGSIGGGGRYDKLIGGITGKDVPAVGMSIGLDRLLAAMDDLGIVEPLTVKVLIMNLDKNLTAEYLRLAQSLRAAGIATDFYLEPAKLDKQFKYAEMNQIKLAVIVGPDEIQNQTANLKQLDQQKQITVSLAELVAEIKKLLA